MSSKKRKPSDPQSLASYQGLIARLCKLHGVTPSTDGVQDLQELRFRAMEGWCRREAEERRMAQEIFGNNNNTGDK